jgi:hypothetical protein
MKFVPIVPIVPDVKEFEASGLHCFSDFELLNR